MSLIKGRKAESSALEFLETKGLELIQKNYFSKFGEIDLIMLHNKEIIFIEVRARKNKTYGSALDSISSSKQAKISKTAQYFLHCHEKFQGFNCRFDAIVINDFETDHSEIEWVKDAFWPDQAFSIL